MASLVEPLTRRMAGNADSPPLSPPPPPLTREAIPSDPVGAPLDVPQESTPEEGPSDPPGMRYYSARVVCRTLGIGYRHLKRHIQTGRIKPELVPYGAAGEYRFSDADVEELERLMGESSRVGTCPQCEGPLKARSCKLWCGRCGVVGNCSDGSI
jgi:hypothetical protein